MNTIKLIIKWIIKLFKTRYKVTVSFNKEYGDSDDRSYITKKILVQKEKHLKFRDENNRLIEYRSASGLNYIIEDI
jgi:phage-related protein|tara:strand:+ start:612 stop:839 length:228 start_codon:yes stop_codon:yes gene_type:complete